MICPSEPSRERVNVSHVIVECRVITYHPEIILANSGISPPNFCDFTQKCGINDISGKFSITVILKTSCKILNSSFFKKK